MMIHRPLKRGMRLGTVLLSVTVIASVGCGRSHRYARYEPAPISDRSPASVRSVLVAYQARRLDDGGLLAFLRAVGAAPTDGGWSPREMALAALYQRADVAEARSTLAAARAAEITAGIRPDISVSGSVEPAARADEGKGSPWTISLTAGLTFETGGKRTARVARARAGTLAARLRLDLVGWNVAQDAASSATSLVAATHEVRDADIEVTALREVLTLLRARYAEGRISLTDIAQAESDVQAAALAAVQARQGRAAAIAALSRALAVPLTETERLTVDGPRVGACDALAILTTDSVRARALQHRFDVGVALADYAASEADLRGQIAGQYPDVTIGPGIGWDQGILRWILGVGTPAISRARNRGPIAEALARRDFQARRVLVIQDSILAGVDEALTGCRTAADEVVGTDSVQAAAQRAVAQTEQAFARGEFGRTEVALARLALLRAARMRRHALDRQSRAGVMLETAAGVWLTDAPIAWPDLTVNPDTRVPPVHD